jgi:hypothetical protein
MVSSQQNDFPLKFNQFFKAHQDVKENFTKVVY